MAKDGSKRVTFDLSFDCTFEVLLSFWKGAQSKGTKKAPKLAWINMQKHFAKSVTLLNVVHLQQLYSLMPPIREHQHLIRAALNHASKHLGF